MRRRGGARRCAAWLTLAVLALGTLVLGVAPAAAQETGGASINARLLDDSGPGTKAVEGVRIIVRQDGQKIGEARSASDGLAVIPVPSGGAYAVELDRSTIPKGFELSGDTQSLLPDVQVLPNRPKFVIFSFGEGAGEGPSAIDRLADLAASGLRIGLIVALVAVGLSLVFGTTGLINFAQGELVTFGAIVAWFLNSAGADGLGITLLLAAPIAIAIGGALGAGLELGFWRRLRRRRTGNVALLVVSIGLALFLRSVYQIVFGASPQSYEQYAVQERWEIGPLDIQPKVAVSIAICAVVLVVVAVLLLRTRLGTAIRAVTDNSDLAESSGIDVQRVILAAWVSSGVLCAFAGVLLGATQTVEYDMGFRLLLAFFAVMIVGGIGSPFGAMLGGIVLGVATEVSTFWIPTDFKTALYLGVLIVVLLVRPQGILGIRERVG